MGLVDSLPTLDRLRSSDACEPNRLHSFAGPRSPRGDSTLSSGDRASAAFLGAHLDPAERAPVRLQGGSSEDMARFEVPEFVCCKAEQIAEDWEKLFTDDSD